LGLGPLEALFDVELVRLVGAHAHDTLRLVVGLLVQATLTQRRTLW